jgi:hypothetical protein
MGDEPPEGDQWEGKEIGVGQPLDLEAGILQRRPELACVVPTPVLKGLVVLAPHPLEGRDRDDQHAVG